MMCPCNQEPVGAFMECNFDEWEKSVGVNFVRQMRIAHHLLLLMRRLGEKST